MGRKSWQVPVAGFRQILVWPLTLRLAGFDETSAAIRAGVDATNEALDASRDWREIKDLLKHAGPIQRRPRAPSKQKNEDGTWETEAEWRDRVEKIFKAQECAQGYGEFVYFYDFLQAALFRGKPKDPSSRPLFRVWRRKTPRRLRFRLSFSANGHRRPVDHEALIDRLNLYVFDTGAAILVVELDFGLPDPADTAVRAGLPVVGRPQVVSDPAIDPPRAEAEAAASQEAEDAGTTAASAPQDAVKASAPPRPRPYTLADVLTVTDHLRRAYTPFFGVGDKAETWPGKVPVSVEWLDAAGSPCCGLNGVTRHEPAPLETRRGKKGEENGEAIEKPPVEDKPPVEGDADFIRRADTAGLRSAPVAAQWRALLAPLTLAGYEPPGAALNPKAPVWRHVVDERIPAMTWVSLTGAAAAAGATPVDMADEAAAQRYDLGLVSRGDWVRLCNADETGGDELPYAPGFLADFEKQCCYDRFLPDPATTSAVRFLFSGYHVAVVGAGGYFDDLVIHHFRRHYFQMALLANMELATLLAASSRIAAAVRARGATADADDEAFRRFRREIVEIERDFLEFVHVYRFTGISNQIQPTELFERWRKSMRLDDIFKDVDKELDAAAHFVLAEEQARQSEAAIRLTEEQTRQSNAANRLATSSNRFAELAAVGVVYGLPLALIGANLGFTEAGIEALGISSGKAEWLTLIGAIFVSSVVGLAVSSLLRSASRPSTVVFLGIGAIALVAFLITFSMRT